MTPDRRRRCSIVLRASIRLQSQEDEFSSGIFHHIADLSTSLFLAARLHKPYGVTT